MSVWQILLLVLLHVLLLPSASAYVLGMGSTEHLNEEKNDLAPTSFNEDWSLTSTKTSELESDSWPAESSTEGSLSYRTSDSFLPLEESSKSMIFMDSEITLEENGKEAEERDHEDAFITTRDGVSYDMKTTEEWEKDEKQKEKKNLLLANQQNPSSQAFDVESSGDSHLLNDSHPQVHPVKPHSLKSLSLVLISAPTASSLPTLTSHQQRVSTSTSSSLKSSMYTGNNKHTHVKSEHNKKHLTVGNNDVFSHSSHSSNSISYNSNSVVDDFSLLMNETVRVTKAPDSILNLTGELGGSVFLPCSAHHSMETQVSWVRRRDWHILTSGILAYTKEERFGVHHPKGSTDWTLVIKYIQESDAGVYECQVSTAHGLLSRLVVLEVVVPKAVIPGSGEYHIGLGSTITLDCYIRQSLVEPQFIFWYHNSRMINYDRERGGINVHIDTGIEVRSRLTISRATPADSGNYTCAATNTQPASTTVYILDGDKIAAILPRTYSKASDLRGSVSIVIGLFTFQFARIQ